MCGCNEGLHAQGGGIEFYSNQSLELSDALWMTVNFSLIYA